jgi:hypothetical protein
MTRTAAVLLTACLLAVPLTAQDLAAERDRVMKAIAPVKDVDLPLRPLQESLGLVFVREVREPGALNLRLRFTVDNAQDAAASWAIQVKDAAGQLAWSAWAGEVTGPAFWSDEIEGEAARVEVYSARPANPVLLRIDKVVAPTKKVEPLSITGDRNDLASISIQGHDPWIVDRGRSVARVRYVGDNGASYSCTAFLVTRDLMLTNQHCIATASEMDSALVDFDFDAQAAKKRTFRLRELLQTNFALDYALVRLKKPVDRVPLRLDSTHPPDHEQLLIIQHPNGEPKQISLRDCRVDGTPVNGRADPGTDFGHQCDTMTGSSGSPVFRFGTKTVVGLHHLGYDVQTVFNRAVHVDRVLADLSPVHRAEVESGQPPP